MSKLLVRKLECARNSPVILLGEEDRGCEWTKRNSCEMRKVLVKMLFAQSCLTLCNSMDCNLPGSSVHRILQARILEWVATSSLPGDLPDPGIKIQVSCVADGFFTFWATRGEKGFILSSSQPLIVQNQAICARSPPLGPGGCSCKYQSQGHLPASETGERYRGM